MELQLQLVDLRDEIERYERENRPFPPRSGSVSKPRRSTEPEEQFCHAKLAYRGEGRPIYYLWKPAEDTIETVIGERECQLTR